MKATKTSWSGGGGDGMAGGRGKGPWGARWAPSEEVCLEEREGKTNNKGKIRSGEDDLSVSSCCSLFHAVGVLLKK